MNDNKYSGIPLLIFDEKDDTARKLSTTSIKLSEYNIDDKDSNLRSILHQHARDGNVDAVEAVLNKRPDLVNDSDEDGMTALHYAAKYGNLRVIELLLSRGADAEDTEFCFKYTPLHMVAKYGRLGTQHQKVRKASTVSRLIDASFRRVQSLPESGKEPDGNDVITAIIDLLVKYGAKVDEKDYYHMTPLHHAAQKNNEMGARALVKHGAKVNEVEKNGITPLMMACIYGSDALVRLLLSAGADCCTVDKRDNTVYHAAALHGRDDILQLLIRYGDTAKNLLWKNNRERNSPLQLAVGRNHPSTVAIILPLKPANNPEIDENHKWLLHEAAEKGYLEVVKTLIKHGYDVRLKNNEQQLPLHVAAMKNKGEVVRYLLELARDCIEEQDDYGLTPFLRAVSMNALDAVKVLVEYHTDILLTDPDGRTAVYIGAKFNALDVLLYLLDIYHLRQVDEGDSYPDVVNQPDHTQITPMHLVCSNGYMEMVTLLHEHGARIDIMNEDNEIPLHGAAARGQTACVRQLLEWDKRLVMHRDENAETPLHFAAKEGHDITAKVLIHAGADVEAKNSHEETALDLAVVNGQLETVKVLLQYGAVIERPNEDRRSTPLHRAATDGYAGIVRQLLESGATIDRREEHGSTALDLALAARNKAVVEVLLEQKQWKAVMKPSDTLPMGRHNQTRDTPMRRLISLYPDLAEIVFNKCITKNDPEMSYYNFVTYDFELLDDTYMMPSEDGLTLTSESPYDEETRKLKKGAKAYSADYDVVYANHPLKIMAEKEKLNLLSHPLVLALLKYKWNTLGRYVYYFALIIYIIFIGLFTLYITYTPAPYNVYNDIEGEAVDISLDLAQSNATCPDIMITRQEWLVEVKWAVICLAIAQLLKELFQLFTRRLKYITYDNAIECFVYSSAIIVVTDFSPCSEETGLRLDWQWFLAAACAFLSWMNLLLLIRKLPRFGIYVVMFFDILRTFSRFFIIFVLFIVAFSIAFFVLLQNRPEFSSVPSAVLKTTIMMIGELEFTAIFHGDSNSHAERLFGPAIAYPLFLFFCVIMTILLMNLLVGLAVDDIKSVQEKAELKRLSMQVDLVLQVEASMPYIRKLTTRSSYTTQPGAKSCWKSLRSRFGFESSPDKGQELEYTEEEKFNHEIRQTIQEQNVQLQGLQENIDNIYARQVRTEAMIRAVLQHLNINYEEVDLK